MMEIRLNETKELRNLLKKIEKIPQPI